MEPPDDPQNAPASPLEARAIRCEQEFLAALRARRDALGIGYETIEALAGISAGYAGKLLNGVRPMGALTLWLILETLGLHIQLVEDPDIIARNRRHHLWEVAQRKPRVRRWGLQHIAIARRRNAPWLWGPERAKEISTLSHKSRRKKADAIAREKAEAEARRQKRSAIYRANALKRWSKPQLEELTYTPEEYRALRTSAEAAQRTRE